MRRFGERSALIVLALVVLAAVVAGRAGFESTAELEAANVHRREHRPLRAIEHYRRALRWSFPGSSHEARAVAGLESIAHDSEQAGDGDLALLAWRSLLGGLSASRWLYSGPDAVSDQAKDHVARLLATGRRPGIDADLSAERLAAEHRELLDRNRSPSPIWATVLLLGFAGWIASLALIIGRGFDRAGRPHWRGSRIPLWCAGLAFACFVAGLLLA